MLIDCPGCARSYHVGPADLGASGRTVVCPRCDTRWHQGPPGSDLAVSAVSARPVSTLDEVPAGPRRVHIPRVALGIVGAAVGCLAFAALLAAREQVVRALPRMAAFYAAAGLPVNVVGLAFAHVSPERLASNDVVIRGALRNVADRKVHIPRLAFEVRDQAGATLVAWTEMMSARSLAAGREFGFASTPHRLPADSRSVSVRFE